jgi:iron complex transport system substrate-binding protein
MGNISVHKNGSFWVVVALVLIFFAGAVFTSPAILVAANSRTVRDEEGRSVSIPTVVNRVAVPLPWMLNIVTAVGARQKVVGVSTYAAKDVGFNALFPEWVKSQTVIGDLDQMNKEAVLQAKPDLMIVQPGPSVKQMEDIGIPAVVVTREIDTPENIRFIGKVLGQEKDAERLASFYEKTIDVAASRTANIPENERKKVYYTSGPDALKIAGKGLGNAPLIRKAGGILVSENLPGGAGTSVSMEQVLQWGTHWAMHPCHRRPVRCSGLSGDLPRQKAYPYSQATTGGWLYSLHYLFLLCAQ